MNKCLRIFFSILLTIPFIACTFGKMSLRDRLNFHETKSIDFWGLEWKGKPFSQRLSAAPDLLIKKLHMENELYEFKERPVPAEPSQDFADVLYQVESILPGRLRELAKDRIIGVFLVNDLGGTGFADSVSDEKGLEKYAIIVLDKGVLQKRRANEWATWKEQSVFKPGQGRQAEVKVIIEKDADDNVSNAIRYILLHEIGHSLGIVSGVHSSWNASPIVSSRYPFTQLSWKISDGRVESLFDDIMPQRRFIRPYVFNASKLTTEQIENLYAVIFDNTNFPTLHAAGDVWEDFAETFVNYMHVVIEKRPYEVRIRTVDDLSVVYQSCWERGTCRDKKIFMDQWSRNPLNTNVK